MFPSRVLKQLYVLKSTYYQLFCVYSPSEIRFCVPMWNRKLYIFPVLFSYCLLPGGSMNGHRIVPKFFILSIDDQLWSFCYKNICYLVFNMKEYKIIITYLKVIFLWKMLNCGQCFRLTVCQTILCRPDRNCISID